MGRRVLMVRLFGAATQLKKRKLHILRCIAESVSSFRSQCYICKLDYIKISFRGEYKADHSKDGHSQSSNRGSKAPPASPSKCLHHADPLRKTPPLKLPP